MTELHWEPAALGRLTVTQLLCLLSERSPDDTTLKSQAEYEQVLERRRAEEREWVAS